MKKPIAITMGDPSGIGPEIIIKTLKQKECSDFIVLGSHFIMEKVNNLLSLTDKKIIKIESIEEYQSESEDIQVLDSFKLDLSSIKAGVVQEICGELAYRAVELSVKLAMDNKVSAIVTAPLNKEAIFKAGHHYSGHTEILADHSGTKDYAMLLYDEKLKVIHVTTHVSMRSVLDNLNQERIENVIQLAFDNMKLLGHKDPRIAVAGINPHAGENGIFGNEELDIINPAVEKMKSRGINVTGALPADTVFLETIEGKYDVVVAMYHDQGHIPLKILGFHSGVNITVGLPIIRTSVDHGTAFQIAWKGIAKENSLIEAIKVAEKMISSKF